MTMRVDFTGSLERTVPAWAISAITASPTHRCKGIARALLEAELVTAVKLGVPLAIFTVSEWTMCGRFGFAPAGFVSNVTIEYRRAGWASPVRDGRVRFMSCAESRTALPASRFHTHLWHGEGMAEQLPRIVILTGAGVSAESGIRTFRAADGLWEEHRVEDVASPEGFAANPELVQRFYNERRRHLLHRDTTPNAAHKAIAELEQKFNGEVLVVTQNIDDLHERAGSQNVIHMHGELLKARCEYCNTVIEMRGDMRPDDRCANCDGRMRPHIVWFGEVPLHMERIVTALELCDLFAAIGTSGNVYPAAGFVRVARSAGAHTVEINLEASDVNAEFDETRLGNASEQVPKWVTGLLTEQARR